MKINAFLIIICLLISSCSQLGNYNSTYIERIPAAESDEVSYYLSIDKFKYYLNEYSVAMEGKVPDEIIQKIRGISVQDIIKMKIPASTLADAQKYDEVIYQFLKSQKLVGTLKKEELQWNYNFFKNKLNEAFTLTPSKYALEMKIQAGEDPNEKEIPVEKVLYQSDEMTLDSGHYISNRTTRAIFWEAIENERTIEFHLGDSREFLKTLKAQGGEILYEVRPLAKNYNKIFLVKYPGEQNFRYAITNIGGRDRLNHLTHQLSLSNLGSGKLKNKVVIKGDLEAFHESRTQEHILHLSLLPKAQRVIIGQKESIDGKFQIFWKVRALKQLYGDDPDAFSDIDPKTLEKFLKLETASLETLFKDKKIVEDVFLHFEKYFEENPEKLPAKFKLYNFDNFTIEMCDYVFQDENGKMIRWRVVSNVWGDEIVPVARALKATGHTNVTYMGTAGAFAGKGYKVGDLVIPKSVHDGKKKVDVKADWMKIEGAKYGGTVEHVGSPFDETKEWLEIARKRSDFVEVETSYLSEIFNGPKDNVEMYLLISDILGSESETLAHATSSKRKNAQNALLANLFKRDAGKLPIPVEKLPLSPDQQLKALIDKVLANKGHAFRYMIFTKMRGQGKVSEDMILKMAENQASFTDSYHAKELIEAGDALSSYHKALGKDFEMAFNQSVVNGTWNPKNEKLRIVILVKTNEELERLSKFDKEFEKSNPAFQKDADIEIRKTFNEDGFVKTKLPSKVDADTFVRFYTTSGLKNAGLVKSVTYNGSIVYNSIPTSTYQNIGMQIQTSQSLGSKPNAVVINGLSGGKDCKAMMNDLLKVIY